MRSKEIDVGRLAEAMLRARLALQRFRQERTDAVRTYVGQHWSDGATKKQPVNLLSSYVNIVGRQLIPKNPRVMLSTFDRASKPAVSIMQSWVNREVERMDLANTLRRVVHDGLFSLGIAKVALATPADAATAGWNVPAGKPFCERVDLDDFVFDIHARDFREASFIGHRYRAPLEVVRDSKIFDRKARRQLQPTTDSPYNHEGDERISALGRGEYAANSVEFEDFVDLWEVYLPRHRLVLTLQDDGLAGVAEPGAGGATDVLRSVRWLGPEEGPYHLLAFGTVPGNAMPKAPIQDLIDLHDATNRLYRKLIRQGDRQKEVLAVQGAAMEDGSRIQQADDGDIVRNDNPEASVVRSFGGPDQKNYVLAQHLYELFDKQAGGLSILGGLAPQSKTAAQDKMLNENASGIVTNLQMEAIGVTTSIGRALCWYWWHDPFATMKVEHPIPGVPDLSITRQLGPDVRRRIPWERLDMKVDPYSVQPTTPSQRLGQLNQVVTTIIVPMMQLLQQQGKLFDVNAYLGKVATYMDMPDLAEIITISEPPVDAGAGGGGEGPSKPPETTRNYVRRSLGADSQGGRENALNTMMAQASQGQGQ